MTEIRLLRNRFYIDKVGCVFPMVILSDFCMEQYTEIDSILPHAELGPNDHQEYKPHLPIEIINDSLVISIGAITW